MISRAFLFAAAAAAMALPALADPRSDCVGPRPSRTAIDACSDLLDRGVLAPRDRVVVLFHRGRHYTATGRHETAIEDFDGALALAPNTAVILTFRGLANHRLREYTDAVHDFDLAIVADPNIPEAHLYRGIALFELEDYEAALRAYDRAIRLDPTSGSAHKNRADALCALDRAAQSHASRLKAIELGAVRVAALQQLLVRLDLLYSGVTGTLDADTRLALQDWARDGCPTR